MMRALIALLLMSSAAYAADDAVMRPVTTEQVTFTATASGTSEAVEAQNYVVRVVCDVDCLINVQQTPVIAAATGIFLPADDVSVFRVGPNIKIAVTAATDTGGTMHVTEMSQ